MTTNRPFFVLSILFVVSLLLRLIALSNVPLIAEEAYYWMYAKNPQLSYFDHPPMVAWGIAIGTTIFGDSEIGVRFVGNSMMILASVLIYHCGKMWFNRAAGFVSAILLHLLPVYCGIGMVGPMDASLVCMWVLCFFGVSLAMRQERMWGWYIAGSAMGFAMLSKYTGILLAPCALMAVLGHKDRQRHFLSPHPYLGLLLAFVLFSPVIVWNAQNNWASFRFQFIDRYAGNQINFKTPFILLLTQLAVLTPLALLPFAWLLARWYRRPKILLRSRYWMAISFALPPLIVTCYTALHSGIHINWTAPFYVSLFPLLVMVCRVRARRHGRAWRWRRVLVGTTGILVAGNIVVLLYLLVLNPRVKWWQSFGPWKDLAVIVEHQQEQLEHQTSREPLIIGDGKYRLASLLAFYRLPLEPDSNGVDDAISHTTSQWVVGGEGLGYRYWSDRAKWIGCDAIYITDNHSKEVESWFRSVRWIEDPRLNFGCGYRVAICQGLLDKPRDLHGDHADIGR